MLPTIDLSTVFGGAGSDWATGGFWTGRTRDDEDRAARAGSRLGTGGFWTGRTREEQEDPKGYLERDRERMRDR
ncbi:MAG: hypothetical protein ABI678_17625 [Kofleriaceae bacterium]